MVTVRCRAPSWGPIFGLVTATAEGRRVRLWAGRPAAGRWAAHPGRARSARDLSV